MKNLGRLAIILSGSSVIAACAQFGHPSTTPQQPAEITATSDATFMQPAGKPVERIVANDQSADAHPSDRLTALEKRVDLLQSQVDSLMAARNPATAQRKAAEPEAEDVPRTGTPAPAPGAVEPAPLDDSDAAASGAPTALTGSDRLAPPPAEKAPSTAHARHDAALIRNLRIGEHPGETRIVLDCAVKKPFHADLDNDEHILTIDVAGAGWADGKDEHKTSHSPLVSAWQAAPDGKGGTRFVLQLRKDAKIAGSQTLTGKGAGAVRLVVDIAAG